MLSVRIDTDGIVKSQFNSFFESAPQRPSFSPVLGIANGMDLRKGRKDVARPVGGAVVYYDNLIGVMKNVPYYVSQRTGIVVRWH